MWAAMWEMWRPERLHWPGLGMAGVLGCGFYLLWRRGQLHAAARRRERKLLEELEAYEQLDMRLPADGDVRELGSRVCRAVAAKSAFYRVAVLVRNVEGYLYVASSAGMEEATVQALNAWGKRVVEEERGGKAAGRRGDGELGMRVGNRSFAIVLGEDSHDAGRGRAIVVPLRTTAGRVVGVLAVCADGMMSVRRRAVDEAMLAPEALAVKLGRRMENAALAERLLRAEKLAGLGLMAGGVAHALNNPLTAVLGFAELIADTSDEVRVKTDAGMIVREALRMRQTVDLLRDFWRPSLRSDEPVAMPELVRELTEECREKLEKRGVKLVVQAESDVPLVCGSRGRLRQMLEHLLNNAAEAVASERTAKGHAIRVIVSCDGRFVHVVVSDTGPGFSEPGRVFDPFYTTRLPGVGAGLGLSICYGIVREHGGEISAFNLHPSGAAVAVELPVGEIAAGKKTDVAESVVHAVSD